MSGFLLLVDAIPFAHHALGEASVHAGRTTVWEQADPGSLSVSVFDQEVGGASGALQVGRSLELWSNLGDHPWRIFSGRITDVTAVWSGDAWQHDITAAGLLADLGRTPAGAADYPQESDALRLVRILTEVGYDASGIPTSLPGPQLVPRPAQKEGASGLLAAAAEAGSGLLWEDHLNGRIAYQPQALRSIGRPAIWDTQPGSWDDTAEAWDEVQVRAAILWDAQQGNWDSQTATWDDIDQGLVPLTPWELDPDVILLQPWSWEQTVGDLVSWVEIAYGVDDGSGRPSWTDGSLVPPVYGVSLDTILAGLGDVQSLANRLLITRGTPAWNAPSGVMRAELKPMDIDSLPALLIGGRPVLLKPLPPGSPTGELLGFLEGWEHQISYGPELVWEVILHISPAELTAPMTSWDHAGSLTWDTVTDVWDTLILEGSA